jgi:hypothetical protein
VSSTKKKRGLKMKLNKKRNINRMDVEILNLLCKNPGKEFTAKEVEKEIGLAYSQTNRFMGILRNHIDQKMPYTKYFSYATKKNPVTHISQFIHKYDESLG